VECIGKGKARTPHEFGCKVSIVTPVTAPKGGQFVLHAKALHGNPYDGHTLGPVIADLEKLTGAAVRRIHGDNGYRGHTYPDRFRVWISGQARRVTQVIRREMRRRAAVEPVIGHSRMTTGCAETISWAAKSDRIAVLAAAVTTSAYSSLVQKLIAHPVADPCSCRLDAPLRLKSRSETFFTADMLISKALLRGYKSRAVHSPNREKT
jgi:hypothetical protein